MWFLFVRQMKEMLETVDNNVEVNGMTKNEVVAILDAIIADETYVVTHMDKIIAARDYMKSLCRTETNKASGAGDVAKVAEAILKAGSKTQYPCFHGAVTTDCVQYVSNGNVLLAIDKPIELPELKSNVTKPNYGEVLKRTVGYEKEIDFPSLAELKEGLKQLKAERKASGLKGGHYTYVFDDGYCLDLQYMIWAVSATGVTKGVRGDKLNDPSLLVGNGCKMMVLSIRRAIESNERGFVCFEN